MGSLGKNFVKPHSLRHSRCQDASFEVLHAKIGLGHFGGILGKIGEFGGTLGAKLGSLGKNWVKRRSLRHSSRHDASFEVQHAKIGLGVILGQNRGILGSFRYKIGEFGGKLGQTTLTTAFLTPRRVV